MARNWRIRLILTRGSTSSDSEERDWRLSLCLDQKKMYLNTDRKFK